MGNKIFTKEQKPQVVIRSLPIFQAKRKMALITLIVPTVGSITALIMGLLYGVGMVDLWLLISMYIFTMAGVEVGFHRLFSHNAFKCGRVLRLILAVAGSMAAQGNILYWVATHRRHHIHSDTPLDPHSPYYRLTLDGKEQAMGGWRGLWHSHVGNIYKDHATNCTLFARDVTMDKDLLMISNNYKLIVLIGLLIPAIIGGAITLTWYGVLSGLMWGGFVRIFLVQQIYYGNGSFSHKYGGRPFSNGDNSTNNPIFAIPTFGSAYQNNHHAFPRSAQLGFRWYQLDIGMVIISLLELMGLVWDVKQPTQKKIEERMRKKYAVG